MAILNTFEKQPSELKDYDVDYSPWLDPMTDTLSDVISVTPACLTSDDASLVVTADMTSKAVKVWASGGAADNKYKVTIRVHTLGGRTDESELIFKVKDR